MTIYNLHHQWELLVIPGYQSLLAGHSEREIRSITVELRERERIASQQRANVTAAMIAAFLEEIEASESSLRQRQLDLERQSGPTPTSSTPKIPNVPDDTDAIEHLQPKGEFHA